MSNQTSGAQRDQKHADRLDWLRARPDLLAQLPGAVDDVEPAQSAALDSALRQMTHVRLYAPTSSAAPTRWGIRLLVSELRHEHVSMKDQWWATRGARGRAT